jgi:hypothetical protein
MVFSCFNFQTKLTLASCDRNGLALGFYSNLMITFSFAAPVLFKRFSLGFVQIEHFLYAKGGLTFFVVCEI